MEILLKRRTVAVLMVCMLHAGSFLNRIEAKDYPDGGASNTKNVVIPDTVVYEPMLGYKFARATPNEIKDRRNTLFPFFYRLNALRGDEDTVCTVSVVHIGDSHIQADFMTGTTRKLMNHYFGNPGRGLVSPNRLMKSNNGRHYKISSATQWAHSFVVRPTAVPIGITGLGLKSYGRTAQVSLLTVDESFPGEWDFNSITAYGDFESSDAYIREAESSVLIDHYAKSFALDHLTNQIDIDFVSPDKKEICFFGLNLSNGHRGVFYHSIGINGACFGHYSNKAGFYEQLPSLAPELVIVSMGTNESMRAFNYSQFYNEIAEFVNRIEKAAPNVTVLLTTPPETYSRNRHTPNQRMVQIRKTIVDFAENNGYPYWDLFSITGGKGSAPEWNRKQLLTRDKIHFTRRGYEYQGELLFEALMKSYNRFAKSVKSVQGER
ncbi:MAG: GDSL-type esterase/lipase family protein [Prevotellaceae bacterium]|jgi:lysophospholipase L1-like esterase|nr:GDSL-type esterase/lipase family protein [Prevotellaceae bacterium]